MLEAFRYLVTCGLNLGVNLQMTAMAKYYATETMRRVVNHGMDVVGGRAEIHVISPRSCLLPFSVCVFGQGYHFEELTAARRIKSTTFNEMLFNHLGYTFNRTARAFVGISVALQMHQKA